MSASSIPLALVGPSDVHYGFWYSYGTALPKGPMLTVSTFWFKFIGAAIALFTSLTLSKAAGLLDFFMFRRVFERSKHSLGESQCAAIVANNSSPFDTLINCLD